MISEKQPKTQKRNQKIPKCPDIDAEYASCILLCKKPCLWGLERRAEYRRNGK